MTASAAKAATSEVSVWLIDLARSATVAAAHAEASGCLSADDIARADAAADARVRRERRTAYAALRVLLECAAGPAVRGATFLRSAEGKPSLPGCSCHFSLSHTEGFALVAVGSDAVGVDIEQPRRLALGEPHRARIVAAGEGLAPGGPTAGGDTVLLRAWARLEALAKAQGCGIARLLTDIGVRGRTGGKEVPVDELAARAAQIAIERGLVVTDLAMSADLVGAVASRLPLLAVTPCTFPTDWPSLSALLARPARSAPPPIAS